MAKINPLLLLGGAAAVFFIASKKKKDDAKDDTKGDAKGDAKKITPSKPARDTEGEPEDKKAPRPAFIEQHPKVKNLFKLSDKIKSPSDISDQDRTDYMNWEASHFPRVYAVMWHPYFEKSKAPTWGANEHEATMHHNKMLAESIGGITNAAARNPDMTFLLVTADQDAGNQGEGTFAIFEKKGDDGEVHELLADIINKEL